MRQAIEEGAVGVWRVAIAKAPPMDALSPGERTRANRLRHEGARARFVACRTALRGILSELLDIAPDKVVFGVGEFGKPFIDSPDTTLRFNAAHSGSIGLIAVAKDREVGIDIESIDPGRDIEAIAHRYFRPEEYTALARLPDSERPRIFTAIWARKEAYLKARGTGIRGGLASFSVSVPPDPPRLIAGGDWGAWALADMDCGGGHAAAVCAAGHPMHVIVRDWPLSMPG